MKTTAKRKNHAKIDLYSDLARIQNAFLDAGVDVKSKAYEIVSDAIEDARIKSAFAHKKVVNYTTKEPIKSLGMAMLTGLFVGWLMKK